MEFRKIIHNEKVATYLKSLPPHLTKEEQYELFKKYKSTGDPVLRDKLANHNLKLAATVVLRNFQHTGLDIEDLIQHANITLMHAIDMYDPDQNATFGTYAQTAIENSIKVLLANKKTEPFIVSLSGPILIDDDKNKGEKNKTYEDYLIDESESHIEQDFSTIDTLAQVHKFVKKTCTENEIFVFEKAMGIGENHQLTNIEIAEQLNMSHQRISQIKKKLSNHIKLNFKSTIAYTIPPQIKKKNGRKTNAERARLAKLKEQELQA